MAATQPNTRVMQVVGDSAAPFCAPAAKTEGSTAELLFALVGERLNVFYDHHVWLTLAQGSTLAAEWMGRGGLSLSAGQRRHLSELSDQLARQIADSLSREAGLYIAHEMTEALDPRYVAESVEGIRSECQRLLDSHPLPAR